MLQENNGIVLKNNVETKHLASAEKYYNARQEVEEEVRVFREQKIREAKQYFADLVREDVLSGELSIRGIGRVLGTKAFVSAKEIYDLIQED